MGTNITLSAINNNEVDAPLTSGLATLQLDSISLEEQHLAPSMVASENLAGYGSLVYHAGKPGPGK